MDDFDLKNILRHCTDNSSPLCNHAWNQLVSKYKNYIYKVIFNRCNAWYANQAPSDLSDIVNDIANDVFALIFQNNGKALAQFKARDSETAFRGYLATISNRVARKTLQKRVFSVFDDSLHVKDETISPETCWQAFEYLVATLRRRAGKQERHVERNILLFTLYTLEDHTKEMLQLPPVFRGMGHRVVDNVIGRYRAKLTKEDENNLRELLSE